MSERFDYDGLLEVNKALRDERDRLRAALVKCRRELWYCNNQLKYMGATEGYSVTEALCEAGAALTPAGRRWTRSKPTVEGWYWWRASRYAPEVFYQDERGSAYHWRDGTPIEFPPDAQFQGPLTPNEATA